MLTKHRRIGIAKSCCNNVYGIKTKHIYTCRFGESGIGRTSGGWKFPELTSLRSVSSGNFQPPSRCVQSRTHLPASMFVIKSLFCKISSPKFSSRSLKYCTSKSESKSKMTKYNHISTIHRHLMHFLIWGGEYDDLEQVLYYSYMSLITNYGKFNIRGRLYEKVIKVNDSYSGNVIQ
jgi:hypothetical protein